MILLVLFGLCPYYSQLNKLQRLAVLFLALADFLLIIGTGTAIYEFSIKSTNNYGINIMWTASVSVFLSIIICIKHHLEVRNNEKLQERIR